MKYNCEMIRDLMPLCADGIASESSRKAVETHIQNCVECAQEWAAVQGELQIPEVKTEPSEERFRQTAKKYRKRRLFRMFSVIACTLLLLFCFANSPLSYGHLTAGGALRSSIRHSTLSKPSDFEIVMEKRWKHSERTLNESYSDVIFWIREKENPLAIREYAFAHGEWNLYDERMASTFPYDASKPITVLNATVCTAYNGATLISAIVTDSAVKTVRLTLNGETQSVEPNQYGMCLLQFQFNSMLYLDMDQGKWQGEALDADGNVIYRMQHIDKPRDAYLPYTWTKVSS